MTFFFSYEGAKRIFSHVVVLVLYSCIDSVIFLPSSSKNGDGPLQAGLRSVGLNTLLSLIETAGLVDALSGEDALTVFAPTDAALKRFIGGLPSTPGTRAQMFK